MNGQTNRATSHAIIKGHASDVKRRKNRKITREIQMQHISPLLFTVMLLASMASLGAADERKPLDKPNILVIFADDWGWGDMSLHKSPYLRTPNLDKLFSQGTEFHQFHVNSPVCSPSRAALYTGQFPGRNKVFWIYENEQNNRKYGLNDWLDPEVVMLPRLMKNAGYVTGHYGKWHLGDPAHAPTLDKYGIDDGRCWNGPQPATWGHDAVYQQTIDFIREHKDVPFFMNLWTREPHTPHWLHNETLELPWIKELPEDERVYAAVAWEADQWIGKILNVLKELDLEKNTIVVFSSDNGPEETGQDTEKNRIMNTRSLRQTRMVDGKKQQVSIPMNGYGTYYSRGTTGEQKGKKRSLFGGGVRTPFAIRWPSQIPAGRIDKTSVISAVDMLPTLCAIAGASLPDGYQPDGENILPALLGKEFKRNKPILWENHVTNHGDTWPQLAVVKDQWRLVMTKDSSRLELFNIFDDWEEDRNLAISYPAVVKELKSIALDYSKSLPSTDTFDERLCVPKASKP